MRRFISILSLSALVVCLNGCTRTYISTGAPGVPSSDGDTRFCLTAHGATVAHTLTGPRSCLMFGLVVALTRTKSHSFPQRYKFVGADLWGHVQWISTNEVVMHVYDYPDGVSRYDAVPRQN